MTCTYLYIFFLNPPNSILLASEPTKCHRRGERTHTNRTRTCKTQNESSAAVGIAKRRRVKKSFSIRGINAQTDTGLCVHYNICDTTVCECVFRFGTVGPKTRTHEYPFTCIAL